MLDNLKFPIGQPEIPKNISETDIETWINVIENFPLKLENLTSKLTDEQLDTAYRKNGWTIRQVIHHCADSHMHSYIRFKWALTEDNPVIKAYFEDRLAELFDYKSAPILLSLNSLKSLHAKWVFLLKGLNSNDLKKGFIHPESQQQISLNENIGIYAWHCDHHFAHIYNLMKKKNWIENE